MEASSGGFRVYALLTLLCAILFLPGISSIPPVDRDEARFMQASKQMLETGDWVQINFQDEPRNKKPIGIYWLQAASVQMLGKDLTAAWPYRLPSVLAAWLTVLATYYIGQRLADARTGLIAATALATSFIVIFEAHIAKTDATLLAATTVAMAMLGCLYVLRENTLRYAVLFWLALGIGILIKGPITVLVAGAAIATLCVADRNPRLLKALRAEIGIPIVLIVVLPWLTALSQTGQGGFIGNAVREDLLPKLIGGHESHGAPPGTYLLSSLLTAWPWSLLAPFALIAAWKHRAQPMVRFCLAWLIPAWIVFEIVPTKLPHYTMPLYPALMLLIAWMLSTESENAAFLQRTSSRVGLAYRIFWALIATALGGGVIYAAIAYGTMAWPGAIGAAIAAALVSVLAVAFVRRAALWQGLAAVSVLFAFFVFGNVLPYLDRFAVSPRLAALVVQLPKPAALAEYHEPSAVFLLGTGTRLTTVDDAIAYAMQTPGHPAVIPKNALEKARTLAGERKVTTVAEVDGYNYSKGDPVNLAVITIGPLP